MNLLLPFKRILVWLFLLAVAALVWVVAIGPLLLWRSDVQADLGASRTKAERLIESITRLEQEKRLLSTETNIEGVWTAGTASKATALVQAGLSTLAREQGIAFRSIAPLENPDMPLMSAVAFRVEAEVTLDRLVSLLRKIEFSSPILLVERGTVRRLSRNTTGSPQPTVFVQLEITAPVLLPEDAQ